MGLTEDYWTVFSKASEWSKAQTFTNLCFLHHLPFHMYVQTYGPCPPRPAVCHKANTSTTVQQYFSDAGAHANARLSGPLGFVLLFTCYYQVQHRFLSSSQHVLAPAQQWRIRILFPYFNWAVPYFSRPACGIERGLTVSVAAWLYPFYRAKSKSWQHSNYISGNSLQ